MGDDRYVVIKYNEDGDLPDVKEMSGDELRGKLKENYWGERPNFAEPGKEVHGSRFSGLVVIKGQIIKPKPVQVATEYDL
jgi:hypothetical protein